MAKAKDPTPEEPTTPDNPEAETTSLEDRMAQMAKDQKKSQDAYRDTGPAIPS